MASTPTTIITKSVAAAAKDAVTLTTTRPAFSPRTSFAVSTDLPRSFFLGHHRAGLDRMRHALANIGLIIECRDFRVPLTSWNPLLETSLISSSSSHQSSTTRRPGGPGSDQRSRIIVYTHSDLCPATPGTKHTQHLLRDFHLSRGQASAVVFTAGKSGHGQAGPLLRAVTDVARTRDALTGLRALVVGMPNAGKSTLLNALRRRGLGDTTGAGATKGKQQVGKVARTGAEPGVTRKLSSPVRIVRGESSAGGEGGEFSEGVGEGVFVVDTPGVFIPYVSDPEAMLKLALVGCVRDGLVARETLADYLLFQLNRAGAAGEEGEEGSGARAGYVARLGMGGPTNDVNEFLEAVARRVGKVSKGGGTNFTAAAEWAVQEWRRGGLGKVILDDVTPESLESTAAKGIELSMNQARKRAKEERKAKNAAKRLGSPSDGEAGA